MLLLFGIIVVSLLTKIRYICRYGTTVNRKDRGLRTTSRQTSFGFLFIKIQPPDNLDIRFRGIFRFICIEDVGREDKDELDANGPKKKTHQLLLSLDTTACWKLEWRCFQTRPSTTDDADLIDVNMGGCGHKNDG